MSDASSPAYDGEVSREFGFEVRSVNDTPDGLTLEGYAAVFDSPTLVDNSYEGRFIETIARGAFERSIGDKIPVLQFDHGKHPLFGGLPIGTIKHIREDSHGLFVRARLSDNWLIQPIRDAIRDGAVKGMSFRFTVKKDSWVRGKAPGDPQHRTLLAVDCPELGPVVFPQYSDTEVNVRSADLARTLADESARSDLARALLADPLDSRSVPDDMSFGDVGDAVCDAICSKLGLPDYVQPYLIDLSDTWAIYGLGDDSYKIAFTMDDSGVVSITGDPVAVVQVTTWVPDTDDETSEADDDAEPAAMAMTDDSPRGLGSAAPGTEDTHEDLEPVAAPVNHNTFKRDALAAFADIEELLHAHSHA